MKGEAIGWLIIHVDDKNVGECTKEERDGEILRFVYRSNLSLPF